MRFSTIFTILFSSITCAPAFETAGAFLDRSGVAFAQGAKDIFSGPNVQSGLKSAGSSAVTVGKIVGTSALLGVGAAGAFTAVQALNAPKAPLLVMS